MSQRIESVLEESIVIMRVDNNRKTIKDIVDNLFIRSLTRKSGVG